MSADLIYNVYLWYVVTFSVVHLTVTVMTFVVNKSSLTSMPVIDICYYPCLLDIHNQYFIPACMAGIF